MTTRARHRVGDGGAASLNWTLLRPNVFGIDLDPIDQRTLIAELLNRSRERQPCYVVPTNLHLVLRVRNNDALRRALADPTALVVPDGRPLQWMAWLRGIPLQLVTGSDLVVPLCRAAAQEGLSVFLFGATFATLAECGRRLASSIEQLVIAGVYSPPFGFEQNADEYALASGIVEAAAPDIVFVALGVPKQEIWAQKHAAKLNIRAICVGASLDFVAGVQRRAPPVFRRIGLEWLWRMLTEPRRLAARYLMILCWLPLLVASDLMGAVRRRWAK
jgi:N-acetylglucosaminyldiphosphoundecaprenol N-acetyl-beta-D-mannosaminyltransferase